MAKPACIRVCTHKKKRLVHSSSFSYLLSASFGPAGPILVASSLRFYFSSCIRSALIIDGGSLLFCKLRIAPSSICILASLGDFSFSFVCCLVLSIRYPCACSFILSHLNFPSYRLQLGMFFFASVFIFNISLHQGMKIQYTGNTKIRKYDKNTV